jgi:hypothetical protein
VSNKSSSPNDPKKKSGEKPNADDTNPPAAKAQKPKPEAPWVDIDVEAGITPRRKQRSSKKRGSKTVRKLRRLALWQLIGLGVGMAIVAGATFAIIGNMLKRAPVEQKQQVVVEDNPPATEQQPTQPPMPEPKEEVQETNPLRIPQEGDSEFTRSLRAKISGNQLPLAGGTFAFGPGVTFVSATDGKDEVTVVVSIKVRSGVRVSGLTGSVEIVPSDGDKRTRWFNKTDETFRCYNGGTITVKVKKE